MSRAKINVLPKFSPVQQRGCALQDEPLPCNIREYTPFTFVQNLTVMGEQVSWMKVASLGLIIAGVVGLNLAGSH